VGWIWGVPKLALMYTMTLLPSTIGIRQFLSCPSQSYTKEQTFAE